MCQLSLETLLPFPTLHRCRSPRTDPHRQHTVKRLSLFQGSKQTYIDLHKQKAISPARVLAVSVRLSSVCRAVGIIRGLAGPRAPEISAEARFCSTAWPSLQLLLHSPATSCQCALLWSLVIFMLFFSHAAAPDGVQYDALPGDLPLGERHSEASRPDFRDAFSAGVF